MSNGKTKWLLILIWILSIVLTAWISWNSASDNHADNVEYVDSNGVYHQVYSVGDFEKVKNFDKALYDSLKKTQDEIDYLLQFDYQRHFYTGQVTTTANDSTCQDSIQTFDYESDKNDTFIYHLTIGAVKEPAWYALDVTLNDKLTIIDKSVDDSKSHMTIDSGADAIISNVDIYKKDKKKTFWQRFHFGPAVTIGYDPINNNFGMMIGVGIDFDLK